MDNEASNNAPPTGNIEDQPIRSPLQLQDGTAPTPMNGSVAGSQSSLNFSRDSAKYKSLDRKKRYPGEPTEAPGHNAHVRRDSWDSTIRQSSTGPPSPASSRVSYPQDVQISFRPDGTAPQGMTPANSSSTVAKSTADLVKKDEKQSLPKTCLSKFKEFFTSPKYSKPRAAVIIILLIIIVLAVIVGPIVYHQQKTNQEKRKEKKSEWQFGVPIVTLGCGVTITGSEVDDIFSYKGVPYAHPPTGNLRWKSPQSLVTKDDCSHVFGASMQYSAKGYRSRCMQIVGAKAVGAEDCLFMNIWTPKDNVTDHPVMVYVHGGDLNVGGSDELDRFNMTGLVHGSHMVVVSINYRLNAFGYLALGALEQPSGNYGLKDQIEALRWIKNNIRAFRGDPTRVTVVGLGSGGTSVLAMIASPKAAGLFHRAWIMSGGLISNRSAAQVLQDNEPFMTKSNCTEAANKTKCLYDLHPEDVVKLAPYDEFPAWNKPWKFRFPALGVKSGAMIYVDGDVLPGAPLDRLKNGDGNKVTLVVGNERNEADLNPPYFRTQQSLTPMETAEFESQFAVFNTTMADVSQNLQRDMYSEEGFTELVSYVRAVCPYNDVVSALGGLTNGMPVYRYIVTARPLASRPYDPFNVGFATRYAFHGQDYLAMFGAIETTYASNYVSDATFPAVLQAAMKQIVRSGFVSNWKMYPGHIFIDSSSFNQHNEIAHFDALWKICNSLKTMYAWWPEYAWVN
ncbi:para-nitrobenzyl esterase-like isoform X2 [Tubulanus polymorphus]|uniref:para-nitrobenzyl esterase-like isoform X2 n=1 Tax=Tubulanus polymorphus TaxID=672921 RepID=UPI003DA6C9BB